MKIKPADLDFKDAHHLLADSLVPRPIALISTIGADGVFSRFFVRLEVGDILLVVGIDAIVGRSVTKQGTLQNRCRLSSLVNINP